VEAVEPYLREILWRQCGAAIDMLENAIAACPDEVWAAPDGPAKAGDCWYLAYHTLFWLDLYLDGAAEGFAPPAPFGLEELDPAGRLPERAYTQDQLLAYLAHGREKCRAAVAGLTDQSARRPCVFRWGEVAYVELLLYTMRHVQHHAAQMNRLLREATGSAPHWVGITRRPLSR